MTVRISGHISDAQVLQQLDRDGLRVLVAIDVHGIDLVRDPRLEAMIKAFPQAKGWSMNVDFELAEPRICHDGIVKGMPTTFLPEPQGEGAGSW